MANRDSSKRRATYGEARFHHALRIRTHRSLQAIEDWLADNCDGAWDIRLEDLSDDLDTKTCVLFFELASDVRALNEAMTHPDMPPRTDPRPDDESGDGR